MTGPLLVTLLALAGCSSGSDSAESGVDIAYDTGYDTAPHELAPMEEVSDADAGGVDEREVVTTGSLTLVAADVSLAADEIVALAERAGGRVDARSESAATEHQDATSWVTVRVPAAELDDTISEVEELGEVRDMSLTSDDVTRQGRDLDARIEALEASTERLIELMAEADSSEALIAAEEALSERQAHLESLRSERSYLSDQVAMSTLEVSIIAEPTAQFEADGFVGGLNRGWMALVGFASAAVVGIGVALPWLVVLGVPIAVVAFLLRRRGRRHDRDQHESDVTSSQ